MNLADTFKLFPQGDREVVMSRVLAAPRTLVFDAFTKPELVSRWLLGPDGWTMPICEIDLRVGGKYRYVWRNAKGTEMGMGGAFREVVAPERLVHTEKFDDAWYPGEALITTVFDEHAGQTTVTQTILTVSAEAQKAMLKSGMETGVIASYNRLEEILAKINRKPS